ncbi:MAG: CHAT domain-containing tetratricopeptide repeat protein [Bacteroidota bacterium]
MRYILLSLAFLSATLPACFSQTVDTVRIQTVIAQVTQQITDRQYTEAEALLQDAIQEYRTTLKRYPRLVAQLYHKLGAVYYNGYDSQAYFSKSLKAFKKALDIRQQYLLKNDPDILHNYYLLFVLCNYYEKNDLALQYGSKAINGMEAKQPPNEQKLAALYFEMAKLRNKKGDWITATDYAHKTIRLANKLQNNFLLVNAHLELGFAAQDSKRYKEAFVAFRQAIRLLEEEEEVDEESLAYAYNNIGFLHNLLQEYDQALRYFERAVALNEKLYKETSDSYTRLALAQNFENLGIVYKRKKQYATALRYTRRSRDILTKELGTIYHAEIAKCLDNFGDIYFEQGKAQKALRTYHKGTRSLVPKFKSKNVSDNPSMTKHNSYDKMTLLTLLSSKARTFWAIAQTKQNKRPLLENSFQTHLVLDSLITQIRQSFQAAGSRYDLIEKVIPVYENAIDVCLQLFDLTKETYYRDQAYFFCAKNKAIVLLEGMNDEFSKSFSGIPKKLLEEEYQLKKSAYELESKLYESQQTKEPQARSTLLEDSLFSVKRQYAKMVRLFEKQYPSYYSLKYAFQSPLTIAELQEQLAPDQLLIEYFVGSKQLYIFNISKNDVSFEYKPLPKNFNQDCIKFRMLMEQGLDFSPEEFMLTAFGLYQVLLQSSLEKNSTAGFNRLLIIPDNVLLKISFDALLTEQPREWNIKTNPYLLKKYAIRYAYSNLLAFDKVKSLRVEEATERFMGFGLEYDDYTLSGLSSLKKFSTNKNIFDSDDKRSIGKLTYSDDEVKEIANLFDGKVWLNQKATKKVFLNNASKSRILHLSMHGIVDEENPFNSALIFTRTSDSIDYLLRPIDLYGTRLNAELVALSACNSAYGNINSGEGIRSLARAFTYAGCPSMVASLWSASDLSTKEIMLPFYKNLQEGMPKDVALQKAKIAYMEQTNPTYSIPTFWSHLILIGQDQPLELPLASKAVPRWLWLLMGLVVVGAVVFVQIRRRS